MTNEILKRKAKYEKQLEGLKPGDVRQSYLEDMIEWLNQQLPKKVRLHTDGGDNICESCQ